MLLIITNLSAVGITELRQIDPLKIKKIRQKVGKDKAEEHTLKGTALEYDWGEYIDYYIYNPKGLVRSITLW